MEPAITSVHVVASNSIDDATLSIAHRSQRFDGTLRRAFSGGAELQAGSRANSTYPEHLSCKAASRPIDDRTLGVQALDTHSALVHIPTQGERAKKFSVFAKMSSPVIDANAVISSLDRLASSPSAHTVAISVRTPLVI